MTKKAILIAAALAAQAFGAESRVFSGMITDTMCGVNHAAMKITPDEKCVRECVRMGKQYKYALYDGKKLYVLSDQATPEAFAAQRVRVKGVLFDKTGIIKVESIEKAK